MKTNSAGETIVVTSKTKLVTELSLKERDEMYFLLSGHFLGATREEFDNDLFEKECVMLLIEKNNGKIVGFSTITHFDIMAQGQNVSVIFSGDTVVLERYRSSIRSVAEIARYFQSIRDRLPNREIYYVLSSKGWRTYRVLPCFFKEFYPNFETDTPSHIKEVLDVFCTFKFSEYYNKERGLLTSLRDRQRLRPETADCALPKRNDAHVKFFAEQNPNYLNGDELVCIASIIESNLTNTLLRFTNKRLPLR